MDKNVGQWNIRCMRTLKWEWGCLTTAIFAYLSSYFFGNFRYKASNIKWRYATHCQPVIDCKMSDLEWPWVAISRQSRFSYQKFQTPRVQLSKTIAWKLINVDPYCQWQKCRSITLVSGNINRLQIFEGVSCRSVFKTGWGRWSRRICSFPVAVSS